MSNLSTSKKLAIAATLAAMGFAGNYLALPVAYNVEFIFGSIFSIIAIGLLGPWWGAMVSIASSTYTCILWDHPYALIIFTLEAAWIGFALKRGRLNIVLIDAVFWLGIGSLLVTVLYGGVMGLNQQGTIIVILKQSLNGLFNSLVASILLDHTHLRRLVQKGTVKTTTYKRLIFHAICTFLMLPAFSLMLYHNHKDIAGLEEQASARVAAETTEITGELSEWLEIHLKVSSAIAELGGKYGLKPSVQLQEELGRLNNLFPDFHNLFLANEKGTAVAFYPAHNERGESTIGLNFADRLYFGLLAETGQPLISDVFIGHGGVLEPTFSIATPVLKNGRISHFGIGMINLGNLITKLENHARKKDMVFTLLDSKDNVIVSNDPYRKSLKKLPAQKTGKTIAVSPGVFMRIPGSDKNTGVNQVWNGAYYFSSTPIAGTKWLLQTEYSVAPMQQMLYKSAISGLGTVACLFLLMISIASAISNYLTKPLISLASISADIPAKIDNSEELAWPQSSITEVAMLVGNFRETSAALGSRILSLNSSLSLAADSAGIGIWEWLVPEDQLIWDTQMYILYGVVTGAFETWKKAVHPEDAEHYWNAVAQTLIDDNVLDTEFRVIWPTGEIRYIKTNALVIRDDGGKPLKMIGINWDITDQKHAEMALFAAKMAAEAAMQSKSESLILLEQEMAERLRAEEELRLNAALLEMEISIRQRAEEALQMKQGQLIALNASLESRVQDALLKNREKDNRLLQQDKLASIGQLAAGVAHEINNPMGFIMSNLITLKGYVENLGQFTSLLKTIIAKDCTEEEQQMVSEVSEKMDITFILQDLGALIAESSEGAERVKRIVADLKDFARTEEKDFKPVDLNHCVESTLNMLRNEIKYVADVELKLGELPQVICSSSQINQVIANLLVNAVHAIDKHGTIVVTTRLDGEQAILEISDTGRGMTEELRKRIFEPFFTTKEVGKGTGLGLTISYDIIKKHGGKITVESDPGKGTVFTVRLPVTGPKKPQV